jgi:hypothetical protein
MVKDIDRLTQHGPAKGPFPAYPSVSRSLHLCYLVVQA